MVFLLVICCTFLFRFGRKPVLFATMAVQTFFSFLQVFCTSWILFIILLFIGGLGQIANFVAALVLGTYRHCICQVYG